MIAVLQRVTTAKVLIADETIAEIHHGLLVLASIHADDTDADLQWMANKIATLRIFPNPQTPEKVYDLDVREAVGSLLLVSNFTIAADTKAGRRPSLNPAASPTIAEPLFDRFVALVRATGIPTQTGRFGANMQLPLTNDGPCTFLLDSRPSRST